MGVVGRKLLDGLRAYEAMDYLRRVGLYAPFADTILVGNGYHPNVAASIIARLSRKGYIECGVSERTGWLTEEGRAALAERRAS